MPKSKVRKKSDYTVNSLSRTPVKVKFSAQSSKWFVTGMLSVMIFGLLWLMVYFLFIPPNPETTLEPYPAWLHWMGFLGTWNFLIGISIIVVGLLMSLGWK